jgi:hypothetical protein
VVDGLYQKDFYMSKYSTEVPPRQLKMTLLQQTEMARAEWEKELQQITAEKEQIHPGAVSWDIIVTFIPNDSMDTETQSKIISLQDRHKSLMERRAVLWAEDDAVAELNKRHALIHNDQTSILTEKANAFGGKGFSLESRQSLRLYYEGDMVECADGRRRSKADLWLASPKHRKYDGIIFDPTTIESKNGRYNLWKGFSRIPQQGDCSLYWAHVRDNICSRDEALYYYVRKWISYVFQHPDKVHTALVLCGSQGVGKNSFVEPLGILLGQHYAPLSGINELVSHFNFHLKDTVLIHANEALWGGNRKDIGLLKAMITESSCSIEGKGKDRITVRNFKHIILSSNEPWPVHLDADDRRFAVIRVSEERKEDHAYFEAIQNQLDNGGYEAFLYGVLHEDLIGFNPRILPKSTEAFDIKMQSTGSAERYLYEALLSGGFSIGISPNMDLRVWQSPIPRESVYTDYVTWCSNDGEHPLSNTLLGKVIKKIIISTENTRPGRGSRLRQYKFPSLIKARQEFCKAFKEDVEHIFGPSSVQEKGTQEIS